MSMEAPKQWILVRKDLNMRKGKMIAQGAHASLAVIFNNWEPKSFVPEDPAQSPYLYQLKVEKFSALQMWIEGAFTKIALGVDSEEELVSIYEKAKEQGLLCSLIEDHGLTEFHGELTKTTVAIGPAFPSEVQELIGHLKLL